MSVSKERMIELVKDAPEGVDYWVVGDGIYAGGYMDKSEVGALIDSGYGGDIVKLDSSAAEAKPVYTQEVSKLYLGVGDICGVKISENKSKIKSYRVWHAMLDRCYSEALRGNHPTYRDCSVCDEWLLFPNFKSWFDDNYIKGFQLDKDLTVLGNKIYSPEFCSFIPSEINSLLINAASSRGRYPLGVTLHKHSGLFMSRVRVDGEYISLGYFKTPSEAFLNYKIAKEAHVKVKASESYNAGDISYEIYSNLMLHEVVDDSFFFNEQEKLIDELNDFILSNRELMAEKLTAKLIESFNITRKDANND